MTYISRAVLLAGGDSKRLLPLTRRICGDERPKQFCSLIGGKTLLTRTRSRVARLFRPGDTFYSVVDAHSPFFDIELADVEPSRILVQPENRGTSAAIAYSLMRIPAINADEIVSFFPTDHHFANETAFREAVELAAETVQRYPDFLVLLGAAPESTDADYWWIEPSLPVGPASTSGVFRVKTLREKPSPNIARELLRNGCLLNTFIMCARAGVFLELLESAAPGILRAFASLSVLTPADRKLKRIYAELPVGDFSRQVLAACASRLMVVTLRDSGWSDLGTEERVSAVVREGASSTEPHSLEAFQAWLAAYRKRLDEVQERAASAGSAFRH